jgi:zinc transporter 1/2/3
MILGTVLLHLMPDMEEKLHDYEGENHIDYPVLEITVIFALVLTMVLDKGIGSRYSQKMQSNHTGPTGVNFQVGERADPVSPVPEKTTEFSTKQTDNDSMPRQESTSDFLESGRVEVENGPFNLKPGIKEYAFAFGISVHAMMEGMGVGFQEDASNTLYTPLSELILHKIMLATSLVVQMFMGRVNWKATAIIGIIYSIVTPIAIAIGTGIIANDYTETPPGILAQAILQAVGSGVLLYVVTIVILAAEYSTSDMNTAKFFFFLIGFLMVAGISFIPHDHGGHHHHCNNNTSP